MPSQRFLQAASAHAQALRQGQANPPVGVAASAWAASLRAGASGGRPPRPGSAQVAGLQGGGRLYTCQPDATRVKSGLPLAPLFARRGYRTLFGGVLLEEVVVHGHASGAQPDILDSPLGNAAVNSPFAKIRGGKPHPGTGYKVAGGTPCHATAKGKMVKAGFSTTYGNVVIIDHGRGFGGSARAYTLYAHASKLLVKQGPPVNTSDVVSLSGNTGRVFPKPPRGYHVHYEVIQTNAPFGSEAFYAFKHKHKPSDLKALLRGH